MSGVHHQLLSTTHTVGGTSPERTARPSSSLLVQRGRRPPRHCTSWTVAAKTTFGFGSHHTNRQSLCPGAHPYHESHSDRPKNAESTLETGRATKRETSGSHYYHDRDSVSTLSRVPEVKTYAQEKGSLSSVLPSQRLSWWRRDGGPEPPSNLL